MRGGGGGCTSDYTDLINDPTLKYDRPILTLAGWVYRCRTLAIDKTSLGVSTLYVVD